MIPARDQLLKINKLNKFILEKSKIFADYCSHYDTELIYTEERIEEILRDEENIEELDYFFPPFEDDPISIELGELLNLADEILNMDYANPKIIKTPKFRYYITESIGSYEDYLIRENNDLSLLHDGIKINFIERPLIVELAAIFLEVFHDDDELINPYTSIELCYEDERNVLSPEEELNLVNSYIFEIADSTGMVLRLDKIVLNFQFPDDNSEEYMVDHLRSLEPYNKGMDMFIGALSMPQEELKFFSFYKVLEYFAPIALDIEANELMCKKLDISSKTLHGGDYIRSIFDLAYAYRKKSHSDLDLIKETFEKCFDFIGLFNILPESIKKKIKKDAQCELLDYSMAHEKLELAANKAGKIIFTTRNMIVHSKSNYKPTGDECPLEEMAQLNKFMKEATSQTIRWYNRLSSHQKQTLIG